MAANYWNSTQKKYWTFTKKELAEIRKNLEAESGQIVSQYPLPDRRLLNIYFSHRKINPLGDLYSNADEVTELGKLAKRMQVRQQALATAQVYMRRFYTKREIRATNPYLVLSTAFYLACKMEECPQHIRIVVGEARQFWPGENFLEYNLTVLLMRYDRHCVIRYLEAGRMRVPFDLRNELSIDCSSSVSQLDRYANTIQSQYRRNVSSMVNSE